MKKPFKTVGRKGIALILSVAMVFTMIPNLSYALEPAAQSEQTQSEQQTDPNDQVQNETGTDVTTDDAGAVEKTSDESAGSEADISDESAEEQQDEV